jgi:hypothetical protein
MAKESWGGPRGETLTMDARLTRTALPYFRVPLCVLGTGGVFTAKTTAPNLSRREVEHRTQLPPCSIPAAPL